MAKRKPTVRGLKKKADILFSIYKRMSEGDGPCCTCGKWMRWKDAQCGHYISRAYNNTRYDKQNTARQCAFCNVWREGEKDLFGKHLQERYGEDIIDELRQRANKKKRWTVWELEELCEELKLKIKLLEKKHD